MLLIVISFVATFAAGFILGSNLVFRMLASEIPQDEILYKIIMLFTPADKR